MPAAGQQTLTVEDLLGKLQNRAPGAGSDTTLTTEELARLQRNRLIVEEAGRKASRGESFRVEERTRLADISKQPGYRSVDLEVYFEFDSAEITATAARVLVLLGQALADSRLRGQSFLIAGHTDAKGEEEYNQRLSERRAQRIRDFLVSGFGLEAPKVIAIGYGKEELKNRRDPFAAENRRVQIVNLTR